MVCGTTLCVPAMSRSALRLASGFAMLRFFGEAAMSGLAVGNGSSAPQQLADNAVDTSGRTVLIVEDAPDTLTALSLMLQVSGYKVVAARDGLDALHKFEREQPDLVLLDLDLPTVSGFRLIRLFRQNRPA